ncbi:MAG: hypothetical protein U0166_24705 [Acidobacteriota bacterium]
MNASPVSGVAAFWQGFKRALGVPGHLLFVTLLQVWFVQVLFSGPLEILKKSLGGSLQGMQVGKQIDLSVVVEAIISNRDQLSTFGSDAPYVILTYVVGMSLVQAAVLERIRAAKGLPLSELFAAAGNRGLAFVRANVIGGFVLALGLLAVNKGTSAASKGMNLEDVPSELLQSRIAIGAFAGTLFVLLVYKTFVDVLKSRVLIEESEPLFLPFKNVPSVTRLAGRSAAFILKNPLRVFVPTVGNAGLMIVVVYLLKFIVVSPDPTLTMILMVAQSFLFTLIHFSFSAGQLTLAESVVTQRAKSAVVVKTARPSVMDAPAPYTAPAGLDFLQHLPDQLPDKRVEQQPSGTTQVTPAAAPAMPLPPAYEPPPLVEAPRPATEHPRVVEVPVEPVVVPPQEEKQFSFVMQEEMDSGRFPEPLATAAEAPPAAADLPGSDTAPSIVPVEDPDSASTVVLDAAAVQATLVQAGVAPASPLATDERVSSGQLFGDMIEEIEGGPAAAPEAPAPAPEPPPPPAPAPAPQAKPAAAPWNEPKLSVKDIFGDILEELGGELPDSEKDKKG